MKNIDEDFSLPFTRQRIGTILSESLNIENRPALVGEIARKIIDEIRALGWATPGEIRAIVAAAGVRVEIPRETIEDPPRNLRTWTDPETGNLFLEVSLEGDINASI